MSGCGRFEGEDDLADEGTATADAPGTLQPDRPQGLGSWSRATVTIGAPAAAAGATADEPPRLACQKCRSAPAAVVVRQNEPLCESCLEAGIVGRARNATKARGLLVEGDSVLLALSGGAASAALLHCALQLRNANPRRPERGQVHFELRAVHVQMPGAAGVLAARAAAAIAAAAGVADRFRVLPLESVFAEEDQLLWPEGAAAAAADERFEQVCSSGGGGGATAASEPALDPGAPQQQRRQREGARPGLAGGSEQQEGQGQGQEQQREEAEGQVQHGDQQQPDTDAANGLHPGLAALQGQGATGATISNESQQQQQQQQQQRRRRQSERHSAHLRALLEAVRDPTAANDLAVHLRAQLLRRAAAAAGCSKLLLGDCASTIAARVIADAAKGRGFSLPADIQPLDARWPLGGAGCSSSGGSSGWGDASGRLSGGAPGSLVVVLPLREVSMKEAAALAHFAGLPLDPPPSGGGLDDGGGGGAAGGGRGGGVNALASSFVAAMQETLPASIFTVLRTASHLEAFAFNDPAVAGPAAAAAAAATASARTRNSGGGGGGAGGARASLAAVESPAMEAAASATTSSAVRLPGGDAMASGSGEPRFCRVCVAPLPAAAEPFDTGPASGGSGGEGMPKTALPTGPAAAVAAAALGLCYSCHRYVLRPLAAQGSQGEAAAREVLEGLLPPNRWW